MPRGYAACGSRDELFHCLRIADHQPSRVPGYPEFNDRQHRAGDGVGGVYQRISGLLMSFSATFGLLDRCDGSREPGKRRGQASERDLATFCCASDWFVNVVSDDTIDGFTSERLDWEGHVLDPNEGGRAEVPITAGLQ